MTQSHVSLVTQSAVAMLIFAGSTSSVMGQTQTHSTAATFDTSLQSMWASGNGFVYDFGEDYTVSVTTGSLQVNPPAVSGGGVTVDTKYAVSAWGTLGVGIGFGLNSGTVDASLLYDIDLQAPATVPLGEFFQIGGSRQLASTSTLQTTSPTAYAGLDGILTFATNLFAEAQVSCSAATALFGGIDRGTFQHRSYPLVDVNLRETLFGFNPNGNGRLFWKGSDVGGVGQVIPIGNPLAPAAEFTIGDWRIDATGNGANNRIVAQGNTTLLTVLVDIDSALSGGSALTGAGVNASMSSNVSINTGYDVIDFDVIHDISYQQQFALDADVLVELYFDMPVKVQLSNGTTFNTNTVGPLPLDEIPQISLLTGSVTVTPKYTVAATLRNTTDLLFDIDFTNKAAHGWFKFTFNSGVYNTTVNRNFGPLWSNNYAVADPTIQVYDQVFALGGFQSYTGEPFVIDSACYADCDNSGSLNILDYICFGDAYAIQEPYADCDGSATFNILDYICFGDNYAAGCP